MSGQAGITRLRSRVFAQWLRRLADLIELDDSFEGSVRYRAAPRPGAYDVEAAVRVSGGADSKLLGSRAVE